MIKPIVVVGSVNLDLVVTASRIPSPGETVGGDRFQIFSGGKGANQAVAAARLGSQVRMIGRVGDDRFGHQLLQGLREASINVEDLCMTPGTSSGVALISVNGQGQNSIIVVPGANDRLRPSDIERCRPHLQSAGIILTQLEIPMETVECLCRLAEEAHVSLMLDPAPARALSPEILRCVTYLTPNETEARTLCSLDQPELTEQQALEAAELLLESGAANVILKMGARGALIASKDGLRKRLPAATVSVVDSTAAGDAFNGALAAALMQNLRLEQAVQFGIAASAISVTRNGAQPSMPFAHELAAQLQELRAAAALEDQPFG